MDYSVENLDKDHGGVGEVFDVEVDGGVNVSGEMIDLNPVLIDRLEENPIRLEVREYPVDFGYPRNRMYILSLNIPEGMLAHQLPLPINLVTQDKSGVYQYSVSHKGNTIRVMIRMATSKTCKSMRKMLPQL